MDSQEAAKYATKLMLRSMRGSSMSALKQPTEGVWEFDFGQGGLTITCPWRILAHDAVVLGASDHDQKFGLPAPVNVISETLQKLRGGIVENVDISPGTSDLRISFSTDVQIDAFNQSSGYEGWNYADLLGAMVVAMGGGKLAVWDNLPRKGVKTEGNPCV